MFEQIDSDEESQIDELERDVESQQSETASQQNIMEAFLDNMELEATPDDDKAEPDTNLRPLSDTQDFTDRVEVRWELCSPSDQAEPQQH